MSFQPFLKALVFLAILFVMLYIGMHNTDDIAFSFPIVAQRIKAPAAIIYFLTFAAGVLAGVILMGGGKSGGSKGR